jgi:membrane fusion protein (multidrug efflux system)
VVTGSRIGTDWVVEQGLKPGDRVIVEGQLKVRPGALVAPQPEHAAGAGEKAGI